MGFSEAETTDFISLALHNVLSMVGLLNAWTLNVCPNPWLHISGSLQICPSFYLLLGLVRSFMHSHMVSCSSRNIIRPSPVSPKFLCILVNTYAQPLRPPIYVVAYQAHYDSLILLNLLDKLLGLSYLLLGPISIANSGRD